MNQDQARRWAEEVELPTLDPHDHPDNQVLVWTASEIRAIERIRREAIAAALVKLTQGQEPVSPRVTPEMLAELQHNLDVVAKAHNKHVEIGQKYSLTDPAPSQQEDRKPLTDEQADRVLRSTGIIATFEALRAVVRATEAAHNIKEKQ